MADKIIFTFTRGERSLVIGDNEFGILDYSGIESAEYDFSTEDRPYGIGSVLKKRSIPVRDISITAEFKPKENGKSRMRHFLIDFFSPVSSGTLTVENAGAKRSISYEVEKFTFKQTNIHERLQFKVDFMCPDPCFHLEKKLVPVMTLVDGWKWKFSLPFRMRQHGALKKNIYNNGHMETPVEIYFKGPAVNPLIINYRTGQYIRLKKELTSDETLYISTEYDNIVVEIQSGETVEDGWDYLDYLSEFWRLKPGDNLIEYKSESDETVKPRGVDILYEERFLGI